MKMQKKVIAIILITIIYIIIGVITLYTITAITTPKCVVHIDILDLTSEEILLNTNIEITNPNYFDLIIHDIEIISFEEKKGEIARFTIEGGDISANNQSTFTSLNNISFSGGISQVITNVIHAEVGAKFFGIFQKTLPLEVSVIASAEQVLKQLSIPEIKLHAEVTEITEEGLIFQTTIEIINPNKIEIYVDPIEINITTDQGNNVGVIQINGGDIQPLESLSLEGTGTLLFEALNAERITLDVMVNAAGKVAGMTQSLPVSAHAELGVPDLAELLLLNESLDFTLFGEFKFRLRGIITTVNFKVFNPSKIPLNATDLLCSVYGVSNNKTKLIAQKSMEPCTIGAKNEVCLITDLNIKYLKLLLSGTGKIFPDILSISISGNFTIEGTVQYIPISLNAYIDLHLLR
jgi:LEA14-like dessication related protein